MVSQVPLAVICKQRLSAQVHFRTTPGTRFYLGLGLEGLGLGCGAKMDLTQIIVLRLWLGPQRRRDNSRICESGMNVRIILREQFNDLRRCLKLAIDGSINRQNTQ